VQREASRGSTTVILPHFLVSIFLLTVYAVVLLLQALNPQHGELAAEVLHAACGTGRPGALISDFGQLISLSRRQKPKMWIQSLFPACEQTATDTRTVSSPSHSDKFIDVFVEIRGGP